MNSVKLLVFMGSNVDFQTWWLWFDAFGMVWRFVGAVGMTLEVDLPSSESASLVTNAKSHDKQKVAKK